MSALRAGAALWGAVVGLLATAALAQRPDEADLFGAPAPAATEAEPVAHADADAGAPPAHQARNRDDEALGGPAAQSLFDTGQGDPDDPLKIGGQFYTRAFAQVNEKQVFRNIPFSAPTLLDLYLDARPSPRVRAMVTGRLRFDPTLNPARQTGPVLASGAGTTASNNTGPSNPSVALDQMWVNFDLERTVYVTFGKQQVKWGASRFWNPTDYLSPQRRDPLAIFDERLGLSMLKLHLPIESKGYNFYAIALLDQFGPSFEVGRLGAAGRAEFLVESTEVGLTAVARDGRVPRFGLDFSSPLGDVDIYGEVGVRTRSEAPVFRERAGAEEIFDASRFEQYDPGVPYGISGGATYTLAYSENDTITLGLEGFYNSTGATTPALYPLLIFNGTYTPFYAGRAYGAFYALLIGPGSWERTNIIFSTLGNLSDTSFISRLDLNQRVLTYLQVEAFVSVNYGLKGGEFRFGLDLPPTNVNGQVVGPLFIAAPVMSAGLALRVDL